MGMSRLDPITGAFTYYKHDPADPNSLGSDAIYALHEDTKGNLWIGTRGAGLNVLKLPPGDDPYFQKITTQNGLVNDWILGIEEDQHGNIWASGNGLSKIKADTREVKSYLFSESNQGAFYKSPVTGRFFLGASGFDIFHPDSIKEALSDPRILISSLSRYNASEQSGTPIPVPGAFALDSITFSYRDRILAFEFLSLDYGTREERRYAYQLENFNRDWIQLGTERKITFIGLSPGKYQLRVRAVHPSGEFGRNEASLALTILPPWWRSGLAYASYMVFFVLSMVAFIRWRTLSLKREKVALEFQVKERTKEIADQKNEIESQRDEIEAQRDEVKSQRDLVIEQKNEIIDSINYAAKIQTAMLPPRAYFTELLNESFIFYRPRDIVSGDFYWIKQVNQCIVLVAADCTGHGIPGALMSMLGLSYLNEIVQRREITEANQILNELRSEVKFSLRQHGRSDEAKDGIDLALCVLDLKKMKMQFSGANNSLYLIRDVDDVPELKEIKADRMPIGYYPGKDKSFTNQDIQLEIGDTFYIFSDGFIDQKGGPENKKFMTRKFKSLLLEIHELPMFEQKEILERTLLDWMGITPQMDDIMVIGVRI
jgi:serine phosphatase RsbU (regulator of sigma subunit)